MVMVGGIFGGGIYGGMYIGGEDQRSQVVFLLL